MHTRKCTHTHTHTQYKYMHYAQLQSFSPFLGSCPSVIIPCFQKQQCRCGSHCPVHLSAQAHRSFTHLLLPLQGLNMHVLHLNHHHFPNCCLRCPGGTLLHADHSHDGAACRMYCRGLMQSDNCSDPCI